MRDCAKALAAADSQYQYLIDNNCIEDTPKAIEDWGVKCREKLVDQQKMADAHAHAIRVSDDYVKKHAGDAQVALAELLDQ